MYRPGEHRSEIRRRSLGRRVAYSASDAAPPVAASAPVHRFLARAARVSRSLGLRFSCTRRGVAAINGCAHRFRLAVYYFRGTLRYKAYNLYPGTVPVVIPSDLARLFPTPRKDTYKSPLNFYDFILRLRWAERRFGLLRFAERRYIRRVIYTTIKYPSPFKFVLWKPLPPTDPPPLLLFLLPPPHPELTGLLVKKVLLRSNPVPGDIRLSIFDNPLSQFLSFFSYRAFSLAFFFSVSRVRAVAGRCVDTAVSRLCGCDRWFFAGVFGVAGMEWRVRDKKEMKKKKKMMMEGKKRNPRTPVGMVGEFGPK